MDVMGLTSMQGSGNTEDSIRQVNSIRCILCSIAGHAAGFAAKEKQ
jgi:hypothetical protein